MLKICSGPDKSLEKYSLEKCSLENHRCICPDKREGTYCERIAGIEPRWTLAKVAMVHIGAVSLWQSGDQALFVSMMDNGDGIGDM